MKAPKNFDKINLKHFTTPTGNEYKMGIEHEDLVWAFREPDTTPYCLAVVFNWKMETYEVKRAKNGMGTKWDKTLHEGNINKQLMGTMDEFIDWFSKVITVFEYDYK
jgi:hypothetical protein